MELDPRCCGTGTCIIDKDGKCWCGQQWDGEKMCFQPLDSQPLGTDANHAAATQTQGPQH